MSFRESIEAAREVRFAFALGKAKRVLDVRKEVPPVPALPGAPAQTPPADPGPATTIDWHGIPIQIDRPRGFVQSGVDDAGTAWKRHYYVDYGAVPNTLGGDDEGLDVYVGLDKDAPEAHWIVQKKADGTFDEYKVMLGFPEADYAKAMYLVHTPKRYFGDMYSTSIGMMKALLNLPPSETLKALSGFRTETDAFPDQIEKRSTTPRRDGFVKLFRGGVITKAEDTPAELRYTLGIVLEPEVVDAQGDIYSADEIRKACWEYMSNFRNVGLMHKGLLNGRVRLVENWIAPVDFELEGSVVKAGTWLMGLNFVDDALWKQAFSNSLSGLSIGGFAEKEALSNGR